MNHVTEALSLLSALAVEASAAAAFYFGVRTGDNNRPMFFMPPPPEEEVEEEEARAVGFAPPTHDEPVGRGY